MQVRGLDTNGDWLFGKGISDYKTNTLAVQQNIETRLKEWVGDCFFNTTAGIDWQNRLGKTAPSVIELDVRRTILLTDGVFDITSVSISSANRVLTIDYSLRTIYSSSIESTIILEP